MTLQATHTFKGGKAAHDVETVNTSNKMITEIKDLCLAQSSTHTHTHIQEYSRSFQPARVSDRSVWRRSISRQLLINPHLIVLT